MARQEKFKTLSFVAVLNSVGFAFDLVLVESLRMTSILQPFPFLNPSCGEAILTARRHLAKFWSLKEHNVLFDCLL